MSKDLLIFGGIGIAAFIAWEYYKNQTAPLMAAAPIATTPQVSNASLVQNLYGKLYNAPQVDQAGINAITQTVINSSGFLVNPDGQQVATPAQWNVAWNKVYGVGEDWNSAFLQQNPVTFSQWYAAVQSTGLTGLGTIGKGKGWNNATVSRYELIAAQFPR